MSSQRLAHLQLTARQEKLCRSFVLRQDKLQAYREAYEPDDRQPAKLVRKGADGAFKSPAVQLRIRQLQDELFVDEGFTALQSLRYFLQIAYADVNELVSLRRGACRHCHGADHARMWKMSEYLEALAEVERFNKSRAKHMEEMDLPATAGGLDYDETAPPVLDCPECHGEGLARVVTADTNDLSPAARALYGGVKQTPHGLQVMVADRMKAMELAARIAGHLNNDVKITAELKAMGAVVNLTTTDPNEAARIYQDMIANRLT